MFSTYKKSYLNFNLSLEVNFHIKLEVQDHRFVVNLIMGCHSQLTMYAIKEKNAFLFLMRCSVLRKTEDWHQAAVVSNEQMHILFFIAGYKSRVRSQVQTNRFSATRCISAGFRNQNRAPPASFTHICRKDASWLHHSCWTMEAVPFTFTSWQPPNCPFPGDKLAPADRQQGFFLVFFFVGVVLLLLLF